jgi:TolB-like protein
MSTGRLKYVLRIIFTSLFFLILSFKSSFATETIRMAILDFEANNTSKYVAKAVTEFISTEMAKKSELAVIERTQMGAILNEQGFQQLGCTDQSCAVEMGKLLSAKKILLGTLTKTETAFIITAKSVDVETGRIDFAESERCMKEDDLELASKILAVKLVNNIAKTSYTTPLRTYQQDESRNRFAVGLLYKLGMIKGVKVPFFTFNGDGTLKLGSDKRDIINQSAIISPSYEFTKNYGVRTDFKYMYSKFKDIEGSYGFSSGDYGISMEEGSCIQNGYGVALNFQMIYPIEGFNFYLIPGIGMDKYVLDNFSDVDGGGFWYHSAGFLSQRFDMKVKGDVYTYIFKLETGFSVYVSKFIDLYFSAGVDLHLFSELISDVKIVETETSSSGIIPAEAQNMLQNSNVFEGNFPPEYYLQAGIILRMF